MSLSPVAVAPVVVEPGDYPGRAEHARPPRQTPALWLPRVDSLAEFGLMISRQLTQCRRYGGHLSVLWLEATPESTVDDGARHGLITAVGRRLRSRVRGTDMVLQVGETSFAVLLLDAGIAEGHLVHDRLATALKGPYGVDAQMLQVRLQMGVAAFPEGGLRGADLAESARQDLRRRAR